MIASPINGNVVVGNSEHVVAGNVGTTGLMWKNGTRTHYFQHTRLREGHATNYNEALHNPLLPPDMG